MIEMIKKTTLQTELVDIRRHLHRNPEVGMELPATKDFVWQKLVECVTSLKAAVRWGSPVRLVKARESFYCVAIWMRFRL